jgi:beta-glucosidase
LKDGESMKKLLSLLLVFVFVSVQFAQEKLPYKDPTVPIEKRVEDLLNRMTLDEKIDMIGGTGVATKVNERLGIPELRMTDGPAGVQLNRCKSMAFPAPIAMAATWNPELVYGVGGGIGRETKGHARHVILGPCVNIARMPMGGRNFESYGEDPFLSSRMGVAFINGVQKEGVAATVKHFAVNNEEIDRMYVDAMVSRRALNEIYFPAFKAAVQEANTLCLMSSYNKVNGRFAGENDYLLKEILRKEWRYKGLIMSDWWATHSSIPTALGALDIEMPNGDFMNIKTLKEPIESGIIPVETINEKVRNILTLIFKLGLFDKPLLEENQSLINSSENRKIAYETSLASIVLLKNDQNILPLNKDKIKSIAVIGPNGNVPRTGGGGSSEVNDINPVTLIDGLKNKLPNVNITFEQGAIIENNTDIKPIESKYLFTDKTGKQNGLNAEYYNNIDLVGTPVLKRIDKDVNFSWDENGPGSGVAKDHYSVRWNGYIKVSKTDDYVLGIVGDDGMRLWLDDKLMYDAWYPHAAMKRTSTVRFEKGKYYKVNFEIFEKAGGAVGILGWDANREELYKKAVEAAKKADCVILSVGTTNELETEGRDRPDLFLPNEQDKLIERVAAVNKNVIVVLTVGSPVVMDKWINKVKGVVDAWFPGTEGGNAIADILLGNANPSGKLPMTFPHKWEDCSAYPTYNQIKERTYYSDDIYVGYRHFDKNKIEPLFPFGYGLSYTSFEYSNIGVSPKEEGYEVTFDIKNTGKVKGEEVAQLYVASTGKNIDRPVKELKGFSRVALNPGEQKNVTVKIDKSAFAYFSEQFNEWKIDPGLYKILVGASSRDLKLSREIEIK